MNAVQSAFLSNVVPAAQRSQRDFGIPASVTIAQAILESGWGQSALAVKANNFFGIKANAHAAPDQYAEFPTTEFVDGRKKSVMAAFARYATPADSFNAHAKLLATTARYAPAMEAAGSPRAFAFRLMRCGYSTNPEYSDSLIDLIDEYDLTQYDLSPEPPAQAQEKIA